MHKSYLQDLLLLSLTPATPAKKTHLILDTITKDIPQLIIKNSDLVESGVLNEKMVDFKKWAEKEKSNVAGGSSQKLDGF